MSDAYSGGSESGANRSETRTAGPLGIADWLCLAAAPIFALMALLTGVLGGDARDILCMAGSAPFPLGGMVPMYVLMSTFHLASWLKLFSRRCSARQQGASAVLS